MPNTRMCAASNKDPTVSWTKLNTEQHLDLNFDGNHTPGLVRYIKNIKFIYLKIFFKLCCKSFLEYNLPKFCCAPPQASYLMASFRWINLIRPNIKLFPFSPIYLILWENIVNKRIRLMDGTVPSTNSLLDRTVD